MSNQALERAALTTRLKYFIVGTLNLRDIPPEAITDDEPLIGGRLGLDSLDALSLGVGLEEEFGITIDNHAESRAALASIASLVAFIQTHSTGPIFAAKTGPMSVRSVTTPSFA